MSYKIAIDGPAGAGKGYVAKTISKILGIIYIDTGAMYRAFGLYVNQNNIDLQDEGSVEKALTNCNISFKYSGDKLSVYLNGVDVEDNIRTEEAGMMASKVSSIKSVRQDMVRRQREMGKEYSVIMEGRDIGSVVFPDAEVKIYLTADVTERAKRRLIDLKAKGLEITLEEVIEDIKKRDEADINKPISPLIKTEDAIEIDTTNMTREEVVNHILEIISRKGILK